MVPPAKMRELREEAIPVRKKSHRGSVLATVWPCLKDNAYEDVSRLDMQGDGLCSKQIGEVTIQR